MSSVAKRNRKPEPYRNSKHAPPAERDEREGEWSVAQRLRMDLRFRAAVERAIARGLERRPDGEAPERAA